MARGGGFPGRDSTEMDFGTMALKVPGGRNGSNSSPYPKVPEAGNTG